MKQIEKRSFEFRVADAADASPKLEGHAAVFNEEADIAGLFLERVAPGAFAESITKDDVRALFNHDPNFVLGRSIAKTLELKEDEKGLAISIVPPDTQFAKDLVVSMRRGDISQMSFGFQVLDEEWRKGENGGMDVRTLKKVRLFDVSPVTFPAYEGTDIAVRKRDELSAKKSINKTNLTTKRRKLNVS